MNLVALSLSDSQARKAVPIHGVPLELFGAQVGSIDLAKTMIKAGWIQPVIKNLYDTGQIAKCWVRILKGENPYADLKKRTGGRA